MSLHKKTKISFLFFLVPMIFLSNSGLKSKAIMIPIPSGVKPANGIAPFQLSSKEVSFEEYLKYCREMKVFRPDDDGWGFENRPVIDVNFNDALGYCNWLSKKEGLTQCYSRQENDWFLNPDANGYRLPRENEWEWAAGGGMDSPHPWAGSNDPKETTWFFDETMPYEPQLSGSKEANPLGLYDMCGNVWEWCWPSEGNQCRTTGQAIRGGSFTDPASHCTIFSRETRPADTRYFNLGFRIARNN